MTLHPRSRFLRYIVYFVCLVLVLVAVDLVWAQSRRTIHPRYDTTRIVEPTFPDGSIDYLVGIEAFFSRGVTPENNAVPLIFEALGRVALPKNQPPDGITDRLQMPHLPEKGDYFVTFDDYIKIHGGKSSDLPEVPTDLAGQPGPFAQPARSVIDWLAANEKPLAKIRQASLRPRYFLPFNGGNPPELLISILLPHLNPLRQVTTALEIRANVRAAAGDIAAAREDALTLHHLARLMGQAATLVERVVATATELRACYADREIMMHGKLSSQDLRAYAAELAAIRDLDSPADAIDNGERAMVLDTTQHLAHLSPIEAGKLYQAAANVNTGPAPQLFPFLPIPYEQSMIEANRWYDGLLVALQQPSYRQRRDALDRWAKGIEAIAARDSYMGLCSPDWGVRLFMPSLNRFEARWEKARAEMRLTRASLLLAAYKADRNNYPASLDELATPGANPLPLDNFTDRSLGYHRNGDGYTLYSLGPNLIDEGGAGNNITLTIK